jgi:hypothetical protein
MRVLLLASIAVLLAACQSLPGYQYPTGPVPGPQLTKVTLNSDVRIRPDRASEYIQYGEVIPYNQVSEYYPHCIFGLRTVSESERTIKPDTFTVTGIHRDRFMAGLDGLLLAQATALGGDYNPVMSTTTISLHSDRQPEVFRLICQQLDEPYLARHVSVSDMQKTLGTLFTLE